MKEREFRIALFVVAVILQLQVGLSFKFCGIPIHSQRRSLNKFSRESSHKSSISLQQSIVLDIDGATELSTGSFSYPPMVSIPCASANGKEEPILKEIVKPPNVEALYDWYCDQKQTPDADPSWGVLWPTAMSLTNYLLASSRNDNNVVVIQNKTVVELGAGLGLCGLVAAALGATCVTLTDREPYALHCALATAACNSFSTNVVKGAILDWSNPVLASHCEVILASDVLYDGETIKAFANACEELIDPSKGGLLLLSDPKEERFPAAREMLRESLVACGEKHNRTIDFEVFDLPPVVSTLDIDSTSTTMDGRDHEERMKEPTVLIRCNFGKRETILV
eukprot:CAMPEP_0116121208 /NCGR_PEP_ID=MMETSP0329-20121206/3576_1 /TAXON_ID=697910 /ORGANISM="Pseudo-nitzschia arenysensis, Strain B593" /LENGTH=337 /DNA_ID=CAMNT_0003615009 /DNA_START=36 /DNA_END=1049 /DNA_ORIENTATION=-